MITINNIDIKNILNNLNCVYKVNDNYFVIFMEPNKFKELGYNELGFVINKTDKWLRNATNEDLKDATVANKIVRVYKRTGFKWRTKIRTLMYIVNSTFYKSKVGTLCLEQNTFKQ